MFMLSGFAPGDGDAVAPADGLADAPGLADGFAGLNHNVRVIWKVAFAGEPSGSASPGAFELWSISVTVTSKYVSPKPSDAPLKLYLLKPRIQKLQLPVHALLGVASFFTMSVAITENEFTGSDCSVFASTFTYPLGKYIVIASSEFSVPFAMVICPFPNNESLAALM